MNLVGREPPEEPVPDDADISHMARKPVALVTGATRGIGRAIACALAESGHDLVITGRTVVEGTAVNPSTGRALPGSLDTVRSSIMDLGGICHCIQMDILDIDSLEATFDRCVAVAGGRIDVLVNNAVYVGPGNDALLIDSDQVDIVNRVNGNMLAPLVLTRSFIRHVLAGISPASRDATVLNVTSDAGQRTPRHPAPQGGWSLVYAATKAGFHRIADMVALEYGHLGIRALNVDPGLVATERVLDSGGQLSWIAERGATPNVIGTAIVDILNDRTIANGEYVHVQHYLQRSQETRR